MLAGVTTSFNSRGLFLRGPWLNLTNLHTCGDIQLMALPWFNLVPGTNQYESHLRRYTIDGTPMVKSCACGRLVSSLALIARPQTYCKVQNTHSTCREFHCPPFTRKSYHTSEVLSHNSYQTDPDLQSECLQHWFKNWYELRRNKLTASTFGMAIGFWPRRRVQLWLEKVGAIEPFSGDFATFWTNMKEEEALVQYKLQTGNPIHFPKFQVYGKENPQDDWLAGSPDGMVEVDVYGGCRSSGVVEIKCPYYYGDNHKAYPWSRIPLYCMPQAQGLMEIMDKDWMDLYVWTLNGSNLFRIPRDREYWELVKMALSDFWWEHVQPAKEMYGISNVTNPLIQLRSLKPAPRHELCGAIVHWSKCLVDDSVLLMQERDGITLYSLVEVLKTSSRGAIDDTCPIKSSANTG